MVEEVTIAFGSKNSEVLKNSVYILKYKLQFHYQQTSCSLWITCFSK